MVNSLKEINNIKGVSGAFIGNFKGLVLASAGDLENIPLTNIAKELKDLIMNEKVQENLPERIQYDFDSKTIIIQFVKNGFIVVFCESNQVNALLRLSLNVSFSKLKNNKTIMENIANAQAD